jgi:hypothetical protein
MELEHKRDVNQKVEDERRGLEDGSGQEAM